jgi:hypothetical protein
MIADNRARVCGTCRWFVPVLVHECGQCEEGHEYGQCRRHPPVLLKPGAMNGVFPVLESEEWCGEHDHHTDL